MAFPVRDWRNYPDPTTPIDAAGLENVETRLSDYADDVTLPLTVMQSTGVIAPCPRGLVTATTNSTASNSVYTILSIVPTDLAGPYTKMRVWFTSAGTAVNGARLGVWDWLTGTLIAQTADITAANITSAVGGTLAQNTFALSTTATVTARQILTLGYVTNFTTTSPTIRFINWVAAAYAPEIDIAGQTGVPANPGSVPTWGGVGTSLGNPAAAMKAHNSAISPYLELVP